jgi:hypothetical protein
MPLDEFDPLTRRSFEIHEAMMAWLRLTYPQDNPLTILTACTYEIGRIVNIVGEDLSVAEREDLLQGVVGVMRDQIRSGLTR